MDPDEKKLEFDSLKKKKSYKKLKKQMKKT